VLAATLTATSVNAHGHPRCPTPAGEYTVIGCPYPDATCVSQLRAALVARPLVAAQIVLLPIHSLKNGVDIRGMLFEGVSLRAHSCLRKMLMLHRASACRQVRE